MYSGLPNAFASLKIKKWYAFNVYFNDLLSVEKIAPLIILKVMGRAFDGTFLGHPVPYLVL